MDIFNGLNALVKTVSADKKAARWFVIIVVIALVASLAAATLYINKPKKTAAAPTGQCDYLIEQNRQLVNSLLDIKNNLKTLVPGEENQTHAASGISVTFDTAPVINYAVFRPLLIAADTGRKPPQQQYQQRQQYQQYQQQQQAIYKIINKIDSTIIKYRIDSMRKADFEKRKRN